MTSNISEKKKIVGNIIIDIRLFYTIEYQSFLLLFIYNLTSKHTRTTRFGSNLWKEIKNKKGWGERGIRLWRLNVRCAKMDQIYI